MKKGRLLASLSLSFIPMLSFANFHPVLSLGFGGDLVKESLNQNITIISPYQNTYNSGGNNLQPVGGLFLGVETNLYKDYLGQVGLSYYQSKAFTITGSVYQFADPTMNNLAYQYYLTSQRFLVETKFLSTFKKWLHPYITAGAGEAINQAYQYQEIPVATNNLPMSQGFNNHTQHAFTYEIGLGMDVDLSKHLRFGAGYRYVDLGKAGLGTTPLQESNQTIQYNHLHVNEFLMQLSYKG